MLGGKVANEANRVGVIGREAQELTTTIAGFPLGNLLSILQSRIQDINWAVMGTNARDGLSLCLFMEDVPPLTFGEDPIVSMIIGNFHTTTGHIRLKLALAEKRVFSSEGWLMVALNVARGGIIEDGSTIVSSVMGLFATGGGKTAANSGLILINVDLSTRLEFAGRVVN